MMTYNAFGGDFYRMADELSAAVERLEADYGPEIFIQSPSLLFMKMGAEFIAGIAAGLAAAPRRPSALRALWWRVIGRRLFLRQWRRETAADYRDYGDEDEDE